MKVMSGHYNGPETCRTAFVIPDHMAILLLLLFLYKSNIREIMKKVLKVFTVLYKELDYTGLESEGLVENQATTPSIHKISMTPF